MRIRQSYNEAPLLASAAVIIHRVQSETQLRHYKMLALDRHKLASQLATFEERSRHEIEQASPLPQITTTAAPTSAETAAILGSPIRLVHQTPNPLAFCLTRWRHSSVYVGFGRFIGTYLFADTCCAG